jgi:hypothetical protein
MKKVVLLVALLCCSTVFAAEDIKIENSFKDFCKKWLQIKKKFQPSNVFCKESNGVYVAEYSDLSEAHDASIKKTVNKKTPFIGILKYREKVFKNTAASRERALSGPFTTSSERMVTELFIYQNGEWQW